MSRILLIEDDEPMRSLIRRTLERTGHQTTEAGTGQGGLEAISRQGVDLVITDLLMPQMDGIEFILHVRQTHPGLPIIAVSGGGRMPAERYLTVAQAGGASKILAKPFTLGELNSAVDELLGP